MQNKSSSNVELWVCPHCNILMGIETRLEEDQVFCNCLNCGTSLPFTEVGFLSFSLVKNLNKEILALFDDEIHDEIRFSWVSNRTLGIIFSIPMNELLEEIDFDIEEIIENELADKYGIVITVYYE